MLTKKNSNNESENSEMNLSQPSQNGLIDKKVPLIQNDSTNPIETNNLARKFALNLKTAIQKMNIAPAILNSISSARRNTTSSDESEEENNQDFGLDADLEISPNRRKKKKIWKLDYLYNLPEDLWNTLPVDKLKDLAKTLAKANPLHLIHRSSATSEFQFERPKKSYLEWRLVRAAVTIIIWYRRCQEAVEETNLVMRGIQQDNKPKTKKWELYIDPQSKFKTIWDCLISLTIPYYAFVIPLRWSQGIFTDQWLVYDQVLDVITWIDIYLSFITGVALNKFLIRKRKEIITHYLSTYFIFDLISVLPIYLISYDWYFLKLIRLKHFKRTYDLLKRFFIAYRRGLSYLNFFCACFFFVIALNLFSAIWIYLGRISIQEGSWILSLNNIFSHNLKDAITLFIIAEYFISNTVFTVGYGDVAPKKPIEMGLVMCLEIFGIILAGLLQVQFEHFMYNRLQSYINAQNKLYEEWILTRLRFREKFRNDDGLLGPVPPKVKKTLNDIQTYIHFIHSFSYRPLTHESSFFTKLPASVKTDLALLTFEPILRKFNIFFDHFYDNNFKKEILSRLKPEMFSNYQLICEGRTRPKGIYFILKGAGSLMCDEMELFKVTEGFYFGDSLILDAKSLYNFTAGKDLLYCLYITQKEILDVCSHYPSSRAILKKIAFQRYEVLKNTIINFQERLDNTMKRSQKKFSFDEENLESLDSDVTIPKSRLEYGERSPVIKTEHDLRKLSTLTLNMLASRRSSVKRASFIQTFQEVEEEKSPTKEFIGTFQSPALKPQNSMNLTALIEQKDLLADDEVVSEGSRSDSEEDLDDSLEVPLERSMNFNNIEEVDEICEYLEDRTQSIKFQVEGLQNTYREQILHGWLQLKRLLRKID